MTSAFSSALLFIGAISTLLGGVDFSIGIYTLLHGERDIAYLLLTIGIGGLFLTIGICFLIQVARSILIASKLKKNGVLVKAKVIDVAIDPTILVNGCPTYIIVCSYVDDNGKEHRLTSSSITRDPGYFLNENSTVDAYVDDKEYMKNYFIDLKSIEGLCD